MAVSYEAFAAEVSRRLEYTYAEDLPIWKSEENGVIDIGSPILKELHIRDAIFMNQSIFGRLFLLDMLRKTMKDYTPIAFLHATNAEKENLEDGLISVLMDIGGSEEGVLDFIDSGSVLSKRLRAKRVCEVEDELIELAQKGRRVIVLSTLESLPYLDAESREKGYQMHSDALIEIAKHTGLVIIIFSFDAPKEKEGAICLSADPVRRKFLPPSSVIITKDNREKTELGFSVTERDEWSFSTC